MGKLAGAVAARSLGHNVPALPFGIVVLGPFRMYWQLPGAKRRVRG